jgi:hypothetical protein
MAERHRAVAVMRRTQKQFLAVASRARVRRSGGRRVARWKEAVDLDERGTLAGEIRDRIAGLLAALGEPLPRACSEERLVTGYG